MQRSLCIDFICVLLKYRFIESEPTSDYKTMLNLNEEIHMVAADFLHFIISKIDHVDTSLLAMIHKTVINKMLYCINHSRLDLQSRLLHLLHATILMGTTPTKKPQSSAQSSGNLTRDGSIATFENSSGSTQANGDSHESLFRVVGSSPLFVKTVFDALSVPSNRPILQHWMDFLMLALPFLTNYFRRVLLPVIQCLCDQILRSRAFLLEAYADKARDVTGNPNLTDQDLMIFLTGLERMLTFSLSEARLGEEVDSVHKQEWSDGLRGTHGLVANVLGTEVHPSDSFQENKVRTVYEYATLSECWLLRWSDICHLNRIRRLAILFYIISSGSFTSSQSSGLYLTKRLWSLPLMPRQSRFSLLVIVSEQE